MYYLDSPASSLISTILTTDAFIFSWEKKFTKILKEMSKIRVVAYDNENSLLNPVTKKQRLILEAFGLASEDIRNNITKI